jgi:AcrR family transcriptional regulator
MSPVTEAPAHIDGRRARGDSTRRAILGRAMQLASAEGLEDLSIARLAGDLGMSKSGLFAHFGSKEELQLSTVRAARRVFYDEAYRPPAGGNSADHYFRVLAHTSNPYVLYKSNVLNGHSVDNLAPAAPLLLTAQRVGTDVNLKWNRAVAPDLRDYSIYRASSTGVTPVPINFLSSSEDTVAVDAGAPTSALYYIVTALDVHANQSPPSNEASVGATTGVGNTPPISALTVLDNMPNPFTGTTTLRVGLPKASEVEIEVFDVAGRSVRSEHTSTLAAGWREISFDARDATGQAFPSGVYFYRVKAAGEAITRKMVIAR